MTLDLPGFGASAKPVDHPYSIHGAADAVEALWARRGVATTIVVAHDYSVSLAQDPADFLAAQRTLGIHLLHRTRHHLRRSPARRA